MQTTKDEGVDVRNRQGLHFLVELLHKLEPVVEANLEYLAIVDLRDPNKIEVTVGQEVAVWEILNQLAEGKSVSNTHLSGRNSGSNSLTDAYRRSCRERGPGFG